MESFDLVSSLQALPETDPIEVDGIQFGGGGGTCVQQCVGLTTINVIGTGCVIGTVCK
ncbi:MAG: VenA family class IV lanthipeptide [Pseudonocardiaceae bacterium]